MSGTVLLLAASPVGRGCLVDAASVLPVLAAVPPAVLSGTETANVVELADPLDPQAVLTRLRAAAAAPGPLTVYIAGQLQLDRRQCLPHLALARTTAATMRYTALPWHWVREELRLRPNGATTLFLDLHADQETWRWLRGAASDGAVADGAVEDGGAVGVPGGTAGAGAGALGGAAPGACAPGGFTVPPGFTAVRGPAAEHGWTPPPGFTVSPEFTPPPGRAPAHEFTSPPEFTAPAGQTATPAPGFTPPPGFTAAPSEPGFTPTPEFTAPPSHTPVHEFTAPAEFTAPPGFTAAQAPAANHASTPATEFTAPNGFTPPAQPAPRQPAPSQPTAPQPTAPQPAPLPLPLDSGRNNAVYGRIAPPPSRRTVGTPTYMRTLATILRSGHRPPPDQLHQQVLARLAAEDAATGPGLVLTAPGPAAGDPHARVADAVRSGRHTEADALAAHHQRTAAHVHGPASEDALHWAEVRADLAMFAGDPVRSCRAWLTVAEARLRAGQAPDAPAVEAAVDRAHHQWGRITAPAQARELGTALAALRSHVPGRREGALAHIHRQLHRLQTHP